MKRNKAIYLDYFIDGNLLIPALFFSLEENDQLMDATFEGKLILKAKQRGKGA